MRWFTSWRRVLTTCKWVLTTSMSPRTFLIRLYNLVYLYTEGLATSVDSCFGMVPCGLGSRGLAVCLYSFPHVTEPSISHQYTSIVALGSNRVNCGIPQTALFCGWGHSADSLIPLFDPWVFISFAKATFPLIVPYLQYPDAHMGGSIKGPLARA